MRTVDRSGSEVMPGMMSGVMSGTVTGVMPGIISGIVTGTEACLRRPVVAGPVMVVAGTVVVPSVVPGAVVVSSVVPGAVLVATAVVSGSVVTRTVLIPAAVLAGPSGLFLTVAVIVVVFASAGFDAFGHQCCTKNQGCCCSDNFLHDFIAFIYLDAFNIEKFRA